MINKILEKIISKICKSDIESIGLMGSYSRGEAQKYSDIDIVCILKNGFAKKSPLIEIIEGKYVVINYVTLNEMEECFTDPVLATENILGLQQVRVLYDTFETFTKLKLKAQEFMWTSQLQVKANEIVSMQLVGWLEEVHKALQGLISNDVGRMLNGLFGLTYGMFNIVRIHNGILLDGENTFYNKIVEYYGIDSNFVTLSDKAFGITKNEGIKERVVAGLYLFDEITEQLIDSLREVDKIAISLVKKEIHQEMNDKIFWRTNVE